MIYHRGLAEALGVDERRLEEMTVREMVERAHDRGGELRLSEGGGAGPGLTLSADRPSLSEAEK